MNSFDKSSSKGRLVPVIAMMIASFCVGIVYIWSAYKAAAEAYYSWTPSAANMVSSIMLFAFTGGCFTGGYLQDRIGPKRTAVTGAVLFGAGIFFSSLLPASAPVAAFYGTYSILAGIGSGFVYTSSLNGMQKWFPDKLGLATGLASATFGLSTVLFSPVCTALLNRFTMPMTLRIFSVFTFVICFAACLFIRIPDPSAVSAAGRIALADAGSKNLPEAMHTSAFWIFFLCLFFYNGTWNMLTPLIKGLGMERGLSAGAAVLCLSMTGITNTLGRLIMSSLSDKIGRYSTMYVLCTITALGALGLTFLGNGGYITAVLAVAFAYGGPSAVYPALCTDLFGPKYSGRNYGFLMLGLGLSSIVFNAISNALVASFGSYLPSFVMGMATAALTLVLIRVICRMQTKPQTRLQPAAQEA